MFVDSSLGTRVTANWLNTIQEELIYLLTQAGITPLTENTDNRIQIFDALLAIVEPEAYISTMTNHETFTVSNLVQRARKYILDPNGADRNFNSSGAIPIGFEAKIINKGGANNIIFDSTGIAEVVTSGSVSYFIYDGIIWR